MNQQETEPSLLPKPFTADGIRRTLSRIIFFYSILTVLVKLVSGFQTGQYLAYLIIAGPFVVLSLLGLKIERSKKYSWIYVVAGILLISIIRYYELGIVESFSE